LEFMKVHTEINWDSMDLKKDGTPSVRGLNDYEKKLQENYVFEEGSLGEKLSNVLALLEERTEVNRKSKDLSDELVKLTEETIKNLSDKEVNDLLYVKWVEPIINDIYGLGESL